MRVEHRMLEKRRRARVGCLEFRGGGSNGWSPSLECSREDASNRFEIVLVRCLVDRDVDCAVRTKPEVHAGAERFPAQALDRSSARQFKTDRVEEHVVQ